MRPSDIRLFEHLNKHLAGKQFATEADVKQAVTSCLQTHHTCFFLCRDTTLSVSVEQVLKCQ